MTKEEYLKVVQGCASFQKLDKDTQQKILSAEGADMEKFAAMCVNEGKQLLSAKKEFLNQSTDLIVNMQNESKHTEKVMLKSAEDRSQKNDSVQADNLLNNL